jgi:NhaA family Na+:H+ antiporter
VSDASAPAATAVAEFGRYLRTGTTGGIILVVATAIALIWVNSPLGDVYRTIRDFELGPHFLHLNLSLGYWAKDGLLAIVFFVAGLETNAGVGGRRAVEAQAGHVADHRRDRRHGGAGYRGAERRLGFAGHRSSLVNPGGHRYRVRARSARADSVEPAERARVFLLPLAVVDDLGAIIVIAVLFTASFDLVAACVAVLALVATSGSSTAGCARHGSMCRSR